MPSFDEELNGLDAGGSTFDDELNALESDATGQVDMGASPSGIQFSAAPAEVAAWNAGAPGLVPARPEPAAPADWSETLTDGGIGIGEGIARGVGINPARASGFLAERGAQVARFFGSNVDPGKYGAQAEESARDLLAAAHKRSPYASGIGEAVGEMVPGTAAAVVTGGAVNPITLGAATGALSGLGNSEADTWEGKLGDTASGAGMGAVTGGASRALGGLSKLAGKGGQWFDDLAQSAADSPITKRAADLAGRAAGGMLGYKVGGADAAASVLLGGGLQELGAQAANKVVPGAIRRAGQAAGFLGEGLASAGGSRAAQGVATQGLTQAYGRAGGFNEGQAAEKATDLGRGNLLGEAALGALQHDPSVLGAYAPQFAQAAASPDPGAVNLLITKLAQKDEKFRTGPMLELQKMTAGF